MQAILDHKVLKSSYGKLIEAVAPYDELLKESTYSCSFRCYNSEMTEITTSWDVRKNKHVISPASQLEPLANIIMIMMKSSSRGYNNIVLDTIKKYEDKNREMLKKIDEKREVLKKNNGNCD